MKIPEKVICCKNCKCPIAHNEILQINKQYVLVSIDAYIALYKKYSDSNIIYCKLCDDLLGFLFENKIHLSKKHTYRIKMNQN